MKKIQLALFTLITFLNTSYCQLSQLPDKSNEDINTLYAVTKDVLYGKDQDQKMDVYISKEAKIAKSKNYTVIFLHGGGWYLSDKSDVQKFIQPYLKKGFNVINLNYRVKRGIAAASEDLTSALNFIKENNSIYPCDLRQVILSGFSSGGHIASLVGLSANNKSYPYPLYKKIKIAAIVNFSGPVDHLDVVEKTFMDWNLQITKTINAKDIGNAMFPPAGYVSIDSTSRLEPITYFDKKDPPYFLWHGGSDDQVLPSTFLEFVPLINKNSKKNMEIFQQQYTHSPKTVELNLAYEKIFLFIDQLK